MFGIYHYITLNVYRNVYQYPTLQISLWGNVILASAFHRHGFRYVSEANNIHYHWHHTEQNTAEFRTYTMNEISLGAILIYEVPERANRTNLGNDGSGNVALGVVDQR